MALDENFNKFRIASTIELNRFNKVNILILLCVKGFKVSKFGGRALALAV